MKSFSDETLNFFLQKNLFLPHFGSCRNCMNEFLRQDSQSSYSFGKIYVFSGCKCLTQKKKTIVHIIYLRAQIALLLVEMLVNNYNNYRLIDYRIYQRLIQGRSYVTNLLSRNILKDFSLILASGIRMIFLII